MEALRSLQATWLDALEKLKWIQGESDEAYKTRVARPYDDFKERIDGIRKIVIVQERAAARADQGRPVSPRASPEPGGPDDAELASIFGRDGVLASRLAGFHFRPQQLAMAQAVAHTIADRGRLVAEAGTGTGKTFAYLVPALLYGGKVIVSTGTKTLQDQLYERDLPLLRDALAVPATIAVLKGRANYVCHHHLERAAREGRLPSREDARHLERSSRSRARPSAATAPSSPTCPRTRRSGRSSRRRARTASASNARSTTSASC